MKCIRKLTSLLLLCALLLTLPLPTRAASILKGDCGDNLRWELNRDAGTLTISGTGAMDDFYFSPWESYQRQVSSIIIKSGVTTIGENAFSQSGGGMGEEKKITVLELPDTLTSIGSCAFMGSNITTVEIPASVTSIGGGAFDACHELKSITVSSRNTKYSSDAKGVLYNKKKTELICVPMLYTGAYTVPSTVKKIEDYSVTSREKLTQLIVSEGVEEIGNKAFAGCTALTKVTLPNTLTKLGGGAFAECTSLTEITIPGGVRELKGDILSNWPDTLKKITVSEGVKVIGQYAFASAKGLKQVVLPKSITTVKQDAFLFTSLLAVEFTGNAPEFHETAFKDADITVYYPKNNSTWKSSVRQDYGGNVTWKEEGLDILQQPKSVKAADGTKATVRVIAHGDGLKYQWYVKNPGETSYSKSSVTTSSYSVTMNEERDGRQVYCVVKDKYGNRLKSNGVRLSMTESVKITQQPKNMTAAESERVKVTVAAEGDGVTYQWYYANRGSSKFSKASITGTTYTMTMTEARAGRRVYCVATDKYGKTAKSDTVTLRMEVPELKITAQPQSVTVAEGERAKVTVKAQGSGLSYQWYYANAGKSSFSKATVTGNTYSLVMNEDREDRKVYCLITDVNGDQMKSDTVTLGMITELKILTQPESVRVAEGSKATVSVKAQGDGLKYQWYYANAGKTTYSKADVTGRTYSVTMNDSRDGRRLYCVITDAYGNTVTTEKVSIRMK